MKNKNEYHLTNVDYDRADDGEVYVAIGPMGRTQLGRMMAVGQRTPFELPGHGAFASMGGLILWLLGEKRSHVRDLYGEELEVNLDDPKLLAYEDVLYEGLFKAWTQNACGDDAIYNKIGDHKGPFVMFQRIDGEVYETQMPQWYLDVIVRACTNLPVAFTCKQIAAAVLKSSAQNDAGPAIDGPAFQRSLRELQAAYSKYMENEEDEEGFLMTPAEFNSLPPQVRQMMKNEIVIDKSSKSSALTS